MKKYLVKHREGVRFGPGVKLRLKKQQINDRKGDLIDNGGGYCEVLTEAIFKNGEEVTVVSGLSKASEQRLQLVSPEKNKSGSKAKKGSSTEKKSTGDKSVAGDKTASAPESGDKGSDPDETQAPSN